MADTGLGVNTKYGAERSIYGRHGKLFLQAINTLAGGGQVLGKVSWLTNVTEVAATMTVDRLEVRRAGDRFVKYKAGEITGEGTLTIEKTNSYFEKVFIDYINRSGSGAVNAELPFFHIQINLEDPGTTGIVIDPASGLATSGHESVLLECVNFWSIPLGYGINDIVSRALDFTFTGIQFGGPDDGHWIDEESITNITRIC
jgi:hypothetical protein